MKKVLIIAPHVDDETLDVRFLLKTKNKKTNRDLLIVTELKGKIKILITIKNT